MTRSQLQKMAHYALPTEIARADRHPWEVENPSFHKEDCPTQVIKQMPGILWTTDGDLRIICARGAGLELLDWRPDQVVGLTLAEFFRTDDPDVPVLSAHLSALAGDVGEWEYGSFFGTVGPLCDDEGRPVGTIGTALDISARNKACHEQVQSAIRIQEANKVRSLKNLAGGVAHNFNNLLSAVIGYTSVVLMQLPVDSPLRALLMELDAVAQCAAGLAGQMMLYSQKSKGDFTPLNLSELIESQWPLIQVSVGKNITLLNDLAQDIPWISGDACQLRQLIMTLVHNASEAIGDQTGTIRLRTQLIHADRAFFSQIDDHLAEGDYLWLQVSDTGCGMDDETQARIFEPFFSTKFTGRGLGMAAAHGVVRDHHGGIFVSSKPGLGSTIHVFLPVIEATFETQIPIFRNTDF